MAKIIFWGVSCIIFYTYLGYSLLMVVLSRLYSYKVNKQDIEPKVTFLITAYNEEKNIRRKLENTLFLDYPKYKLEILVASDGSTDRTEEIVMEFAECGVKLVRVEGRMGKTETQNQAVKQATGEIIIFSDATTKYEKMAIRKIVQNYADPTVGAVSGNLEYYSSPGATTGWGNILFWKYEKLIKKAQTQFKTITGCSGCIYSIRRNLYEPLPADIISDLIEPLKILEKGYRIVFEPEAVVYEETTERAVEEFHMRIRVITRGMRGLLYMRKLLNPFKFGFVSFQLFSHKILRWFLPFLMVILFVSNCFLVDKAFYRVVLVFQIFFYFSALTAWMIEKSNLKLKVFVIPLYFLTINIASIVSLYKVLKGYKAVTWETLRK